MKIIKITRDSGIPLIGAIQFGIIDRGTSWIQVRATSVCNMKCAFCSTSANDLDLHPNNFEVDLDYLVDYVKEAVKVKGEGLEVFLDSVGDPTAYPKFVELVEKIRKINGIKQITTVTNGTLLTKEKIKALEKAGLNRINLSLHSLDAEQAKFLMGNSSYNLEKVKEIAKEISKTNIELILVPVYLPDVNDKQLEDIIMFAKEIKAKLGIQKYETYRHSRKLKEAKDLTYYKFYKKLEELEKKYNVKLKLSAKDLVQERRPSFPTMFKVGEKVSLIVGCQGFFRNQVLACGRGRCVSVNDCSRSPGDRINVRILDNRNNVYVGELI
ncbi:MAG TPA: radical SAM protein [Candidatus Nanoarchaeia archaeon]|nr:radical SAM protein [Candidatus Nanoarchaeia archaeon]